MFQRLHGIYTIMYQLSQEELAREITVFAFYQGENVSRFSVQKHREQGTYRSQ